MPPYRPQTAGPSRPATEPRLAALDALRGLAALSVVLLHFTTDFDRDFSPARRGAFSWPWGAYGVNLFFLISGFVILMTAERARGPREFVASRVSRLYPPYWVAIAITATIMIGFPIEPLADTARILRRAVVNMSMFQSWIGIGSVDSVYWTLQVEMSFYFILLLLIWRGAVDRVMATMTGLVMLALADHLLLARPLNPLYGKVREVLILEHAYLFTTGIVIYKMRTGWRPRHAVILLLCALCPATAHYFPNNPAHDTLIATGLAATLLLATRGHLDWLAIRPLVWLGSISYSLYLTHHWIGLTFLHRADRWGLEPNLALAVSVALSLAVATLMRRFVEQPGGAWVKRLFLGSVTPKAPSTTAST